MAKARHGKPLDDEDKALWDRLAGGVTPLKREAAKPSPPDQTETKARPAPQPRAAAGPAAKPLAPKAPPPLAEAQGRGPIPGLDRRTAERLRRGEIPIEARLDLHGLTQQEAAAALSRFVQRSRAQGLRCLLVITGKGGKRTADEGGFMPAEKGGVLKALVPRWLGAGAERANILAIAPARPQHGGAGALYVLLRKAERG